MLAQASDLSESIRHKPFFFFASCNQDISNSHPSLQPSIKLAKMTAITSDNNSSLPNNRFAALDSAEAAAINPTILQAAIPTIPNHQINIDRVRDLANDASDNSGPSGGDGQGPGKEDYMTYFKAGLLSWLGYHVPPLAVYLKRGISNDLAINLGLTIISYPVGSIAGVVHTWYIVAFKYLRSPNVGMRQVLDLLDQDMKNKRR